MRRCFDELLVNDLEETIRPSPRDSTKSVEGDEGFPWTQSREARMSEYRGVHPAEPALRAMATKLEVVLAVSQPAKVSVNA